MRQRIIAGVQAGQPLAEMYTAVSKEVSKMDFYRLVLSLTETGEIPNVLVCYCGHDCGRCVTFWATLQDDESLRTRAARYYQDEMGQNLPLEAFHCLSGRSDEVMAACRACPFMKCCGEKGVQAYAQKYVNKANQV